MQLLPKLVFLPACFVRPSSVNYSLSASGFLPIPLHPQSHIHKSKKPISDFDSHSPPYSSAFLWLETPPLFAPRVLPFLSFAPLQNILDTKATSCASIPPFPLLPSALSSRQAPPLQASLSLAVCIFFLLVSSQLIEPGVLCSLSSDGKTKLREGGGWTLAADWTEKGGGGCKVDWLWGGEWI